MNIYIVIEDWTGQYMDTCDNKKDAVRFAKEIGGYIQKIVIKNNKIIKQELIECDEEDD